MRFLPNGIYVQTAFGSPHPDPTEVPEAPAAASPEVNPAKQVGGQNEPSGLCSSLSTASSGLLSAIASSQPHFTKVTCIPWPHQLDFNVNPPTPATPVMLASTMSDEVGM